MEATPRTDSSTTRGRILKKDVLHSRSDSYSDVACSPTHSPLRTSSNDTGWPGGSSRVMNLQKKPSASRPLAAFIDPSPLRFRTSPPFLQSSSSVFTPITSQLSPNDSPDEGSVIAKKDDSGSSSVEVGSSEYYKGFVSRSVEEEPSERITGDALLGPTLKFAGGVSIILVLLTVVFLTSNGII